MTIFKSSLASCAVVASLAVLLAGVYSAYGGEAPAGKLQSADSFLQIKDTGERSLALFNEAAKVIQHPRCSNCHPAGDRPMQGEDSHPHRPLVVRGADGFGATGMRCTTCHGQSNFDPGKVPGNPVWHLAPIEMAWVGKSAGAICEQIKDPKRNGGKSMDQLITHMAEDELVGWGWKPDKGRQPVPGTQQQFGELIKAWVATGAKCPAS